MATIQCFICIQQKVRTLKGTEEGKLKTIPEEFEKLSNKKFVPKVEDCNAVNLISLLETPSIVCGGCKLQRYCSLNHRNRDRSQHREICQILIDLQKMSNVAHPLMLLNRVVISSIKQLQETIALLKFVTSFKLRRQLTWREHELIGHPACCQVCFGLENLRACGGCGGVAYCSMEHGQLDMEKHTPKVCRTFSLLYSPYRQLANENGKIIDIKVDKQVQLQLRLESSHLTEVFAKFTGIVIDDSPWRTMRDFQLFASCSSFSGMASICLALKQVSLLEHPQDTCTVYIVGASHQQIERYFQEMHFKLFFLLHKDLCQLELYLIGNQLKVQWPETISFDFQGHKRIVIKHFFPIPFKQFACYHRVDPLLIIMFDIDLGNLYSVRERIIEKHPDNETYNWRKCLTEILHIYGVPICFTSISKALSRSNFATVLEVANKSNIKLNRRFCGDIKENSYREILPIRNQNAEEPETIIYANNYLEVIFTSLKQ